MDNNLVFSHGIDLMNLLVSTMFRVVVQSRFFCGACEY